MRTPPPLDRTEDLQELVRYRIAGLLFMVVLIVALPVYRLFEPQRLEAARSEMRRENIHLGSELYARHCASCHGPEGRGGGPGPTLAVQEFLASVTNRQMHWLIAAGAPGTTMAAYDIDFGGPLTGQDISRLVAFLRSLEDAAPSVAAWRSGAPVPTVADDERTFGSAWSDDVADRASDGSVVPDQEVARQLYDTYCAACHGPDGEGTPIAGALRPPPPPLDEDLDALRRITREGVDGTAMPAFGSQHGGPLDEADIETLVGWLVGAE